MAPKKVRCTFQDCKDQPQRIAGDCDFCNGHFCGKHRLLEDHKCTGLDDVSDCHGFSPRRGAWDGIGSATS